MKVANRSMQMRSSVQQPTRSRLSREALKTFRFPLVVLGLLAVFFCAPWSFEHKAHAYLHGLCAQRPSHSLHFGSFVLPFDARMTGIYGGFLVTSAYLLARHRYSAWRLPSRSSLAALGLFVGALGVDGFNSLLLDVGLPHPYAPDNRVRLVTGLLTGTSLAVGVCFMLATSLWRTGQPRQAAVSGLRELGVIVALQAPFALLALSGFAALYGPLSLLLMASATLVVASLSAVVIVLLRYGDRPFAKPLQAQSVATVALLAGVVLIGAIAAGRFVLERLTNAPPLV